MGKKLLALLMVGGLASALGISIVHAESYEVCYQKYTDSSGHRAVSLTDCQGNDYVVRPQSARSNSVVSGSERRMYSRGPEPSSRSQVQTDESTYARERWCDDTGCYRIRNKPDLCILEVTGELVDCN
ncbi:hypothetical protein [Pragia fontium]|uniref:Hemolysin n=1 Tax=Pragia fontium TaxID=82985 RepID=A0ABQ5LH09_9GAMM|nr:hypothetical protein [Pragia fontium]AKJ41844.1 hypothetical protein QQ39_06895 [Pragia fontium]GKX62137.1 hypothetical protein SOASR032_07060 [Pragia fontium]SUB82063.1 Uncharacterised protein [Pragia fontium]VEJ54689.1 Uncharacterised protein [Pragia fontium]